MSALDAPAPGCIKLVVMVDGQRYATINVSEQLLHDGSEAKVGPLLLRIVRELEAKARAVEVPA